MITRGFSVLDSGDISAATALADEALALALRESDPLTLKRVRVLQIRVCHYRGDIAGVEKHFAAGRDVFEQPRLGERPSLDAIVALGPAVLNAYQLGRTEIGRERLATMRRAANQNDQFEIAFVEMYAAVFYNLLMEYEQAAPLAARALELSEKYEFPVLASISRIYLGQALAQLGRATDGIALIRRGIAEIGTHPSLVGYFTSLAAAQQGAGVIDDAHESIEEALRVNPDALIARPEALRVRGELWLKKGQVEPAEADFRDSIALARSMGAKGWELRSTISLARLLASKDHRDEARAMLAEIYSWFTEGFDTPDLKDAKALLDELGA